MTNSSPEHTDHKLTCFFSYPYDDDIAKWVWEVGKRVVEEFQMTAMTGSGVHDGLREGVVDGVSKAFIVVAETTVPNWWVAFEVFRAIEERFTLLLYLDHNLHGRDAPEGSFPVYPHLVRARYKLPFQTGENDVLASLLRAKVKHYLKQAENYTRSRNNALLKDEAEKLPLPERLINPFVAAPGDASRPSVVETNPTDLFKKWLSPSPKAKRIAIVGYPGYGKTILWRRFAHHLRALHSSVEKATELSPLCLALSAANLAKGKVSADSVLELFGARIADAPRTSLDDALPRRIGTGLLSAYQQSHLLYVLIDGLDELIVPRPDERDNLAKTLNDLGDRGVNLVVTCRRNLWYQRIQDQVSEFEVVELKPIPPDAAMRLLPPDMGPNGAGGGFLTPLGLYFVNALHSAKESLAEIKRRSDLYERWASWIVRCGMRKTAGNSDFLRFFGKLAIRLLRERSSSIDSNGIYEVAQSCKVDVDADGLVEAGLLQEAEREPESPNKYKFFHLSVQEFFIARSLSSEFAKTVKLGAEVWGHEPETGDLGQVRTDYLQASMFGFLEELLGKDGSFVSELHKLLASPQFRSGMHHADSAKVAIQRNLVEYVGMTYRGGDSEAKVVTSLLAILEGDELDEEVRFNAARALERIHPGAPRPYFDYISDWGEKEWPRFATAKSEKDAPYTIQGKGLKSVRPARHYRFSPNDSNALLVDALWREVSRRLAALLERLFEKPEVLSFLRINCSMAWIRWYHRDQAEQLARLLKLAESNAEKETTTNLGFVKKYCTDPE